MDSNLIKLPHELAQRCDDFAQRSVADYQAGRKNESLYFATHGIADDVPGQAVSKMAECAFCLWAGLNPNNDLDWTPQPDDGHDVIFRGSRVDVKQTRMFYRFLLWPFNKVNALPRKQFDTFVLVKSNSPWFKIAGWTSKLYFIERHHVASEGEKIAAGDWYLDESEMWSMSSFHPPDLCKLFNRYGEGTPRAWTAWDRLHDHWCAA